MKRFIIATIAYLTTGVGVYHTFFGSSKIYGLFTLIIGLLGILSDIFYKKLNKDEFLNFFTQQTGAERQTLTYSYNMKL